MTNETLAAQENNLEAEIQALQANIEAGDLATSDTPTETNEEVVITEPVKNEGDDFIPTDSEKVQARINKLHWEKMEAKRIADSERQARQEIEQKLAALEARSSTPEGKPRLADFDLAKYDYSDDARLEAFNDALVKYNLNQIQQTNIAQQKNQEQEIKRAELNNRFLSEVDSYVEKNPTYYQDLMTLPLMSPDKLDLLRGQGVKMVHYLSRNPEEANRFANGDFANAAFQLGTLSVKLGNNKPTPKATNAPAPIDTISGSGRLSKSLDEMSMDEIFNM